jgi:hypothetical protein
VPPCGGPAFASFAPMARTRTSSRIGAALTASALASSVALALVLPGAAAAPVDQPPAKIEPRKGTYGGKTKQRSVEGSARRIELRVNAKGTRIELTVEPTVARDFCIAPPTFVVDGVTPTTRVKRGRFGFSHTFVGSRIDRITGTFVAPDEIEGEALYHFAASDAGLCSAGTTKVRFSAKKR